MPLTRAAYAMSTKTYNGWSNYETWNAALWIDNDGSDSYWRERAEELMRDRDSDRDDAAHDLAKEMESSMDENNPLGDNASMWSDFLSAALREIDWREIAQHFVDDIEVEDEDEEVEA